MRLTVTVEDLPPKPQFIVIVLCATQVMGLYVQSNTDYPSFLTYNIGQSILLFA